MFCYIHYMITRDKGQRSHQIFTHLYQSIVDSGLIEKLSEIRIVTCGQKQNITTDFDSYKKVKVVDHVDDNLLFEFPTLMKIYDDCVTLNDDTPILYMHLKGASRPFNDADAAWTNKMLSIVRRHEECLESLKTYDAAGVDLFENITINQKNLRCFAGNFFWTRAGYVKTLPRPEKDAIMKSHGFMVANRVNKNPYAPSRCNWRYVCEFWIGINNQDVNHNLFNLL